MSRTARGLASLGYHGGVVPKSTLLGLSWGDSVPPDPPGIFLGMGPMSNGRKRHWPLPAQAGKGLMHRWRTGHRDIPCQVASPQSLAPLLPMTQRYRNFVPFRNWNRGRKIRSQKSEVVRWKSRSGSRQSPQPPLDTGPMPQKSQGGLGGQSPLQLWSNSVVMCRDIAVTAPPSRSDGVPPLGRGGRGGRSGCALFSNPPKTMTRASNTVRFASYAQFADNAPPPCPPC